MEKAIQAKIECIVKIVLTQTVTQEEVEQAFRNLHPFREGLTLVLQPVTPAHLEKGKLNQIFLKQLWWKAMDHGFEIRVLPQIHKQMGWD